MQLEEKKTKEGPLLVYLSILFSQGDSQALYFTLTISPRVIYGADNFLSTRYVGISFGSGGGK